ncbi:MAG: exodeoxyribonuclease V subunit gamma [Spirochaetaceae bacterium]|nr:exodeoxyribonuclease V subunit gamma [Spirochaetaceae bacterium]
MAEQDAGNTPAGAGVGVPAPGSSAVVVSGDIAKLECAFVDAVRSAKRADSAAAVLVVVGSHLQHIYLRRLLARSLNAVANVRFLTLMDLAGELALPDGAGTTLPLPDGAHVPLLEQVIAERRSHGGLDRTYGLADAGMVHAVAATIRDLREAAIEPRLVASASQRPWLRTLAAMASAYRAVLAPFTDATERVAEAAAAPPAQVAAALQHAAPGTRQVLAYGIYDVNALQLGMLVALSRALPTRLFLPWSASAEPFAFAAETVDRLRERGLRLQTLDTGTAARERHAARAVFSCADRQAETEETVRRVLEDLADGVPAGDIAILHRMDPIYDEMICGVLDRAAVPYYRSGGVPVRRTVVGRAALNLLQLLYAEPHRGTLLELLSLPGIDLTWIDTAAEDAVLTPRPARWEALSKELGLVKGWEEFDSVLAFHLEHATRGDADERADESAAAARQMRAVVRCLAGTAEQVCAADRWISHADRFLDLLQRFMPAGADTPAWDALAHRIRTLAVLDQAATHSGAVAATPERFRQAAETAIRQAIVSGGYFQRSGVFVGNVMSARLVRFRRVYVTGCAERTFPPVIRQDPLLLDAEREQINRRARDGSYLPLKGRRLDEERLLFELACQAAAERLTLSYPRRGTSSTNVRLPSSFLLEEVGDLAGGFLSAETLERNAGHWYQRMAARIGFDGAGVEGALRALDASDLRWHVLEQGGKGAVPAIEPIWPAIDAARAHQAARRTRTFGTFDGIVPAELVAASGILERDLTATALENLAVCPYRFFLSRVLQVRSRGEPEQTLEIAPLQRGNLVHAILDELVQQFLAGDASWAHFIDGAGAALHEIMARRFAELPAGVTGLPLSWNLIRAQVAEELAAYVDEERRRAAGPRPAAHGDAGGGWQPVAAERVFEGVPIAAGRWRLSFSGRIDRIDRSGGALRIIDYKTGAAASETADGYREGRSLQLAVYLHAAAHLFQSGLDAGSAELHYVSERAAYRRLALAGAQLAGDARFTEVLAAMAEAIAAGAFFYQPGERRVHCRLCDYRDVCHTRVADYAKRKADASAAIMAPFQAIAAPPPGAARGRRRQP